MSLFLVLSLRYSAVLWVTAVSAMDVAEEGSTYNFTFQTFTGNMTCDVITWSRFRFEMILQICNRASYNGSLATYSCAQQPGAREVSTTVTIDRGSSSTTVIIRNVSRGSRYSDEGWWDLYCDPPEWVSIISFELKLFVKSNNTACSTDFISSGLRVACRSEKAYQQNVLYVTVTINKTLSAAFVMSECQYSSESSSLYNSSVCSFILPSGSLKLGRVDLNMTVYPNLTKTIRDRAYGTSQVFTFFLENPRILLTQCSDHDLDEGATLTCTCLRSDNSDLPTNVIWWVNGTELMTSSNQSAVLTVTATRYNTNYSCSAINSFGWQSRVLQYTVSVLYPPTDNDISVQDGGTHLTVKCRSTGNPEPLLSLARNGTRLVLPTESNFTLEWTKSWSCRDGGVYVCGARNSMGTTEKSQTVFIRCETSCADVTAGVDTVAVVVGVTAAVVIVILLTVVVIVTRRSLDSKSNVLKASNALKDTNVFKDITSRSKQHNKNSNCLTPEVAQNDRQQSSTGAHEYVVCLDYGFCDTVDPDHVYQEFKAAEPEK